MRTILGTLVGGSLVATGSVAFRVADAEPLAGSVEYIALLVAVGLVLFICGGAILGWTLAQMGRQEVVR